VPVIDTLADFPENEITPPLGIVPAQEFT